MGGRGSESLGGGWTGGGDGDVKVLSSTELISQREDKTTEVDEVLTVLKDVSDKYDVTVDPEVGVLSDPTVLGYYGGGAVGINKNFFDAKKMDSVYDRSVEQGFHPPRGRKTGLQAVTAHEMGHAITTKVMSKMRHGNMDRAANAILLRARKKLGFRGRPSDMAARISRYARTSPSEAVAEAFADVYCNGSRAKAESIAIVEAINEV